MMSSVQDTIVLKDIINITFLNKIWISLLCNKHVNRLLENMILEIFVKWI
jgi:hypothetical protein